MLAPSCFWEGRSGLDPAAFEVFDFENYQRAIVGYCQNDADQAALTDPALDLEAEVSACSYECLLNELMSTCVTRCVQDEVGLTEECARCYGDNTECVLHNCINDCVDGNSPACTTCRDQYCTAAFEACSG
ncbi:MAG: hypothetical protein ABIJ09_12005 [Pseudomonadota bacterium]